jgi:hypothetical protein
MKKTILFQILMAVVMLLTAYSGAVGETAAAWFGVFAGGITLFLNFTFTQSGEWIASEWKYTQWAVAIAQIFLSVSALVTDAALLPPHIVNYIVIGATVALQYFGKVFRKVGI